MPNPFLSATHCQRYASRVAEITGRPFHVVRTPSEQLPRRVMSDEILHHVGLRCGDLIVEFSAHPGEPDLFQIA